MSLTAKSKAIESDGFYVAAFGIDGALEGLGRWESKNLSSKWTGICDDLLREKGDNFNHNWSGTLSHVRTRFTSSRGAAICTFLINDEIALSAMLLRGHDEAAERDVAVLFVNSLQKAPLIRAGAGSSEPFIEVSSISERPLMVVVPFPIDTISDQDHSVVRELSLHLASAFLRADG